MKGGTLKQISAQTNYYEYFNLQFTLLEKTSFTWF